MKQTIQIIQNWVNTIFPVDNLVEMMRFSDMFQLIYRYNRNNKWYNKVYFVYRSNLSRWVDTEGEVHTEFDKLADTLEVYTEQAEVRNALADLD